MNTRAMSENVTIGIDVGDRFSSFHVLDHQGVCLEQSQIRTTPEALRYRFQDLKRARVVLEVGTHSTVDQSSSQRAGSRGDRRQCARPAFHLRQSP